MKNVAPKMNLTPPSMDHDLYDLDDMSKKALGISKAEWEEEAHHEPKLRTYVKIRSFGGLSCLVKAGITCFQRS